MSWAVVQALAIDGLFFAVWGRVAKAEWTLAHIRKNIPLVAVGLVLALVAALVNNILTYQQVNSLADSIDAIRRLGIDVQVFTTSRAILVVAVGVLVQLFCRSEPAQVNTVNQVVNSEPAPVNTIDTGEHEPLTKRQQVVYWLTDGSKTGAEIAELVNVSKSYVSKVKSEVNR